ncbi:MAG: hypothetical protein ABJO67_11720 [Pseudoruegeria sp.]
MKTHYICQLYTAKPTKAGTKIEVSKMIEGTSESEVVSRAERSVERGLCAGADAYIVSVDPAIGEPGDPQFLARVGQVPELEF